jgi:excisionase family DNA binding protein
MGDQDLLTVREVAAYLRVSRVTVWRWCQQGIIPAFQVGRNWRIRRDRLLALDESANPGDHHRQPA